MAPAQTHEPLPNPLLWLQCWRGHVHLIGFYDLDLQPAPHQNRKREREKKKFDEWKCLFLVEKVPRRDAAEGYGTKAEPELLHFYGSCRVWMATVLSALAVGENGQSSGQEIKGIFRMWAESKVWVFQWSRGGGVGAGSCHSSVFIAWNMTSFRPCISIWAFRGHMWPSSQNVGLVQL